MRAFVPDYEMVTPSTLDAALVLLSQGPGVWKPFAGGTDLMVLMESGRLKHQRFVSLWGLRELSGILEDQATLTIGALTTYAALRQSRVVQQQLPMLAQAAQETGGVATQNRGTLGGNIANGSPAADSPPALLVYEAELELLSVRGTRSIPYATFHTGYKTNVMAADEIISRVRIPRPVAGRREQYRKVGTRNAQAISKVCLAATLEMQGNLVRRARIALGSVAPLPLRCVKTEAMLEGSPLNMETMAAARQQLEAEISPIDDIRSTEGYRRRVAGNLLEEFLRS